MILWEGEVMNMGKSLEEARKIISELSPEDREILTIELGLEMEKVDPEIEKAWIEEAERRWQDFQSGKVKGIPAEEVFEEIERELNEKRNHRPFS